VDLRAEAAAKRVWGLRLLLSLGAGAAVGVIVAIALTAVDLYLTGHGYQPLGAPLLDRPGWGVYLSLADILFSSAAVLGAAITWRRLARGVPDRSSTRPARSGPQEGQSPRVTPPATGGGT
jgi:hypothetical protein